MPFTYDQAVRSFNENKIRELSEDSEGLRFLLLRSLSRREQMERLIKETGIKIEASGARQLLPAIYQSEVAIEDIKKIIRAIYSEERKQRQQSEDELISELYKIKVFDWGGLHQNSLEKTIVNNYVKKIRSFNTLSEKIEDELHHSMRAYVQCSWYNHWTSIIIEDVFRDHHRVLPAVGQIKQIDFFIDDTPFDLKVTYLPEGYIKEKRRDDGLRPETTLLKQISRSLGIHIDASLPEARLLEDLWNKIYDHPSGDARSLIDELKSKRFEILRACVSNPEELIRWLYENQGVRRFDASNRLFLVLINRNDFFSSWKLKRAKPLLVNQIHNHLNQLGKHPGQEITFKWDGDHYKAVSESIFIVPSEE
ncbi:hypothetical protein CEE37_10255 [candidate division LCP-89 bacterium B3_LCP]|uniref:Uncharacterized protein n=1 Tax=candidate division LCP-89 bacterium B3_LCP TaxID=2012998 RepID=A0A532UYZ9_UNCL8|nr:MAG: hypothetical protein CEE37_10255 [candidate division LCP-89 bacterium B3_LCP]